MSISAFEALPPTAFIRLRGVLAVCGISRSTLYELIARGRFPRQEKLTTHAAGWRVQDVRAWLKSPADWSASHGRAGL